MPAGTAVRSTGWTASVQKSRTREGHGDIVTRWRGPGGRGGAAQLSQAQAPRTVHTSARRAAWREEATAQAQRGPAGRKRAVRWGAEPRQRGLLLHLARSAVSLERTHVALSHVLSRPQARR